MPKSRYTSLDLRRALLDLKLQDVVGMRLSNLYDLNRKTYLLKLIKPDHKVYVVLESGIRIHGTQYSRERNAVPSIFAMKLRKHIRTKRLESIEQYGTDRVFEMTFGQGEASYHLIVELYAAGNIILTDKDYKILCLLRSYELNDGVTVAVGSTYPRGTFRNAETPALEKIQEIIKAGGDKSVKNVLSALEGYEPSLIEHSILSAGVDPKEKASAIGEEKISQIQSELQRMFEYMQSESPHSGFIVCKSAASSEAPQAPPALAEGQTPPAENEPKVIYDQFLPFLFKQHEKEPLIKTFNSFNEAADEFFSKILVQKTDQKVMQHETTVERKLDKVRFDHDQRIKALEEKEIRWEHYAQLIESSIEDVEACIENIRASVKYKVDWVQLEQDIKEERQNGNPLALMIHKLNLKDHKIIVLLYDKWLDDAEDEFDRPACPVEIDISMTAFANARAYYEQKKQAKEKTDKTRAAADTALKSAQKKAQQSMKEAKQVKAITTLRKPFWFEKFDWFISSDNYIVIAGRDLQQNEILYKRYLNKGDFYFHADMHGAASVICKNPSGQKLPPITIAQAGSFSLCHSVAWKNKVVSPTFWVADDQVSKTAPTGEYVSSGGFIIRGKKNFCTQNQLVMGFGILFKVADESLVNHIDERKPKFLEEDETPTAPTKGEAQPKHWEPKHKKGMSVVHCKSNLIEPVAEKKKSQSSSSDDIDEELRSSALSVSLVREQPEEPALQPQQPTKKRLTAKERRDLKKAKTKAKSPQEAEGESQSDDSSSEGEEDSGLVEPKQKGPQPQKMDLRKKHKLKKMKKYAWQDENDRREHMEMLGHKVVSVSEEGQVVVTGKGKKAEEYDKKVQELEAKKVQNTERENKRIRKEKEDEELLQLLREEKIDLLSEDDKKRLEEMKLQGLGLNLTSLTGKPHPNDILLFAIPVCAPYDVFKEYKFKAKILPGGNKKGAAIKTVIHNFLTYGNPTPREKELIKAIPEEELQHTMIASPKLSGPGLR